MKKRIALVMGAFLCQSSVEAQDDSTFFDNKQLTQQEQAAIQMAQSGVNGGLSGNLTNSLQQKATDLASQKVQTWLRNLLSYQRGTTEISGGGIEHGAPVWSLLLVRPLTESDDRIHTTFIQGSVFRQGERTTGNLGFGYRQLVADKTLLLGANTFYDWEFPQDHQRASVGLEARTSVGEINANYYNGTTGWINTTTTMQEKVLSGYDAELGVALPYMPAVQARAKTFRWFGAGGVDGVYGNTYSLTGAIWEGIYVEAGHTAVSSKAQDNVLLGVAPIITGNFVKVSWIFGGDRSQNQQRFQFRDVAYSLESMENRRFEKVRRENLLVKAQRSQTGSGFNVTVSGF